MEPRDHAAVCNTPGKPDRPHAHGDLVPGDHHPDSPGRTTDATGVKRFVTPLMALAIFVLNLLLNAPLFMTGEMPFRGSIEGGYVGMARFLSEHPNPWGWNPLPYCG